MQEATFKNPRLKPQIVVLNHKNISTPKIPDDKILPRSIIKQIKNKQENKNNERETIKNIIQINQSTKPLLNLNYEENRIFFF